MTIIWIAEDLLFDNKDCVDQGNILFHSRSREESIWVEFPLYQWNTKGLKMSWYVALLFLEIVLELWITQTLNSLLLDWCWWLTELHSFIADLSRLRRKNVITLKYFKKFICLSHGFSLPSSTQSEKQKLIFCKIHQHFTKCNLLLAQ